MSRLFILPLIGLLLAGTATVTAADDDLGPMPVLALEKYVLDNGLQVILHEDHTIPTAAVNIWYHVGSKNEKPGRTGFAHLFEHMMFQGSAHFDEDYFGPLQDVGGRVNGSTNTDRTNYWEDVPADYLQRALYLEADRMGWLLPALTQKKLDNQRDVVKNEKRQGDNQPYAHARDVLKRLLFPAGHPYRTPVVGSMADLDAATLTDVSEFFARYYTPNNASLCVAGDFDSAQVKAWIAAYFGPIPPGGPVERLTAWQPNLTGARRALVEDDVELPRLYMAWHTPAYYAAGDAEFDLLGDILTAGKTSRLYRKLVYEAGMAQDVQAHQSSRELSGVFELRVTVAAGHTLAEVEAAVDAELARLLAKGVRGEEVAVARTGYKADFVRGLQRTGGFGGKADRLNRYNVFTGDPNYLARDLERFHRADRKSVNQYARQYLGLDNRVVVHIVPRGHRRATPAAVDRQTLPAGAGQSEFTPPPIQTASLANGLDIYLVEKHELPLVELRLNIMSGWSSDPADRAGAAALTADLLDEGVTGWDALELATRVRRIGARLSTSSTFDGSVVRLNLLKKYVAAGLDLMSAVLREPAFRAADFERVREHYRGRQMQEADRPRALAINELQMRCFGAGHPYAQPHTGTGTAASLAALEITDLEVFYRTHYHPNNAALVVVGDVTLSEAVGWAEAAFGDWPAATVPAPVVPAIRPYAGPAVVVIDRPGAPQSFIAGGQLSVARADPAYQALAVVNSAFGGQFTSRINLNLREDKGYTYGVRSELLSLRDGGLFLIGAPVETAATLASVRELRAEMAALRDRRPLVGAELAAGRDRLIEGFPQRFQTHGQVADDLSKLLRYNLPLDSWQTYTASVAAVGAVEVSGVIARYLDPDSMVWVIVGDWRVIGPDLAASGLGEIEVLPPR